MVLDFTRRSSHCRTEKDKEAHRWIKLADEIFADVPGVQDFNFAPPMHTPGMSEDEYNKIWHQAIQDEMKRQSAANDKMMQKYQARLEQARSELKGLDLYKDMSPNDPLFLNNSFVWKDWAARLSVEGHKITKD